MSGERSGNVKPMDDRIIQLLLFNGAWLIALHENGRLSWAQLGQTTPGPPESLVFTDFRITIESSPER